MGGRAMRPRIYPLVEEAVEVGTRRGYRLAHKHVENPTEEAIIDKITDCVMGEIAERFVFDNDSLEG
jgi:hypothetical protein